MNLDHIENIDFDQLLRYVYEELSPSEMEEVRASITDNEFYQESIKGIEKIRGEQKFESSIEHGLWLQTQKIDFSAIIEERAPEKPVESRTKWLIWASLAAAAVVVLFLIFGGNNQSTDQKIYEIYSNPENGELAFQYPREVKNKTIVDSEGNINQDLLRDLYKSQENQKAISLLDSIYAISADNFRNALYFKGIFHRNLDQKAEALGIFTEVSRHPNHGFSWKADIQIGLTYLYFGERENAVEHFKNITENPEKYDSSAVSLSEEILEKLD